MTAKGFVADDSVLQLEVWSMLGTDGVKFRKEPVGTEGATLYVQGDTELTELSGILLSVLVLPSKGI